MATGATVNPAAAPVSETAATPAMSPELKRMLMMSVIQSGLGELGGALLARGTGDPALGAAMSKFASNLTPLQQKLIAKQMQDKPVRLGRYDRLVDPGTGRTVAGDEAPPELQQIAEGNEIVTYEIGPKGKRKEIARAPRFASQTIPKFQEIKQGDSIVTYAVGPGGKMQEIARAHRWEPDDGSGGEKIPASAKRDALRFNRSIKESRRIISDLVQDIEKHGTAFWSQRASEVQSKYGLLQNELKNLHDMGALQKHELLQLERILKNPVGKGSYIEGMVIGRGTFLKPLNVVQEALTRAEGTYAEEFQSVYGKPIGSIQGIDGGDIPSPVPGASSGDGARPSGAIAPHHRDRPVYSAPSNKEIDTMMGNLNPGDPLYQRWKALRGQYMKQGLSPKTAAMRAREEAALHAPSASALAAPPSAAAPPAATVPVSTSRPRPVGTFRPLDEAGPRKKASAPGEKQFNQFAELRDYYIEAGMEPLEAARRARKELGL